MKTTALKTNDSFYFRFVGKVKETIVPTFIYLYVRHQA